MIYVLCILLNHPNSEATPNSKITGAYLRAFQVLFLFTRNEKRTQQWHFCKEIALNNIILRKQARITYFFKILKLKTTLQ